MPKRSNHAYARLEFDPRSRGNRGQSPAPLSSSGDLPNRRYTVVHGQIPMRGGVLSAGDVWQFTGTTNGSLTNGSSYTVLAINLYAFLPCTVATTGANAPDSVVLTGNVIVSVDYLIQYFTRTSNATTANPVGNQIPLHV